MKKIKYIKRQDSGFKLSSGNSGETSLNLSNEIFDFISQGNVNKGEEKDITFRVYKEDCIKAMAFIIMRLPLYRSSSNYSNKIVNYTRTFEELYSEIESFFGNEETAKYSVKLFYRPDGRIYLKGLRVNGFSIRDYLVENYSALQFDDGGENYKLRILSDVEDNGVIEDNDDIQDDIAIFDEPLQQIFYGAPGTGKSYKIKELTGKANVIRTTFHPDSDYSTFVGCYKPTTKLVNIKSTFGGKAVNVVNEKGEPEKETKIVYEFVEQAFLQAYVNAWKLYAEAGETEVPTEPKKQYLIIEEINRGNCAQIFGDLFQLLDRNDENGFSDYYIKADSDMCSHLKKAFEEQGITNVNVPSIGGLSADEAAEKIISGEILVLPNNLYIWATMNTSDQSLFPIDSAFKRRWDWKYMPIADESKGWIIEIGKNTYDWWTFLDKINHKIEEATYSEDKKLGYFFCKAKDRVIDAKKFVGKVLFYLWNDVFKDTDFADSLLKDEDGKKSFDKFYTPVGQGNAEVEISRVIEFMKRAEVEPLTAGEDTTEEEDEDGNTSTSEGRNYDKFSVNGEGRYGKNRLPSECMKKYIELHPDMSVEQVYAEWKKLGDIVPHFIESKEVFDARTDNSKRSVEIACGNSVIYVAKNGYGSNGKIDEFILAVNNANWGITLAKEA